MTQNVHILSHATTY